jgi:hypothetical protein
VHTEFRWGNLRERDHYEPGAVRKIILRSGSWMGGMDWFDLAQDRDRWRAVVNEITNFRVA